MLTVCRNDKNKIKELIKSKQIDAIVASNSDFVDDIILAMSQEGVIDCLSSELFDKRRHNAVVPFQLIMALAIAAKMKVRTSLTDIPYAIQDHRVLAELGFNIVNHDKDSLFTEGTVRHLLGKYTAEELIDYYNDVVQNRIMKHKDIEPNIHILDCTKIAVNIDNQNYEKSSIALDRKGVAMRGYKLASLRGLYKDTGIIEEIRFGTVATSDLRMCEEMLMNTPCFKEGDILINDRGFLSRKLLNYLKTHRGVDTYVPLRNNMVAYEEAVLCAKEQDDWEDYIDKAERKRKYTLVKGMGVHWCTEKPKDDVPINACVIWDEHEDMYWVFVTTDISATPKDITDMYDLRVEIEEDYRQLKDFWKLEDFKSTKYHMIVFHIVCVLFGYLFYQMYINSELGQKYLGKSLPVILKNYKTKFLNYFVIYGGEYFSCMSVKEFFEFRDSCEKDVQEYVLKFFD